MNHKLDYSQIKAKENLIFYINHEIRNPLNGIIGINQILKEKLKDDPDCQDYFGIINSCNLQLLNVLNNLVDYAKLISGKLSLGPETGSLEKIIKEIYKSLKDMAKEKDLSLTYHIDPKIPINIFIDHGRLRQIIYNLVHNGLKFTQKGSVTLKVILQKRTGIYLNLDFIVSDTGIGIPSNKQNYIFQPFHKMEHDNLVHNPASSGGIGLNISSQIARLMNSHIKLESIPGKGSTFTLNLTVIDPNYTLDQSDKNSQTLKILIVDDMKSSLKTLQKIIHEMGHQTTLVTNARDCLQRIQSTDYDLVLTDYKMPDKNGLEISKEIYHQNPKIKIILMSGYPIEKKELKNHFVHYFLMKPILKNDLQKLFQDFKNY